MDGNPKDSQLYEGVLDRIQRDYGVTPRDVVTDGGYASLKNQEIAKGKALSISCSTRSSLIENITTSLNMETRLKKWRSGIEAVISNVKRGFKLFRCDWKGKDILMQGVMECNRLQYG